MTGRWPILAIIFAALCQVSCTGETGMEMKKKPEDWKVQCDIQSNYFGFDASWSEKHWVTKEMHTAKLMFVIYADASLTFYASPSKFANDISSIDKIKFEKNYIEIAFDPDVSGRTLFFYDVGESCSRKFFTFMTGSNDFQEVDVVVDDALVSKFKKRHGDKQL